MLSYRDWLKKKGVLSADKRVRDETTPTVRSP